VERAHLRLSCLGTQPDRMEKQMRAIAISFLLYDIKTRIMPVRYYGR
jgi:hypothetical protein